MRSQGSPITACIFAIVQIAALAGCTSASAQIDVPFPGLAGTFVEAELNGWVMVPSAGSPSAVRLVIAGSQIPGRVVDSCLSLGYPCGTEVHLALSYGGFFEWLYCNANLPAESGEVVVELPCRRVNDAVWASGPNLYNLYIGYDPNWSHICWRYSPAPQLTITAVRLVADAAVGAEQSSWGALKSLFR